MNKIFEQYDGFFIDVWGVVHNGIDPYPYAVNCLNHLLDHSKKIIFLSNVPRPGVLTYQKLADFGIHLSPDMVLTSGDLLRYQLMYSEDSFFKIHRHQPFFHLGAARNTDILSGLTVNVTEKLEEASFILLTAYLDEGENLNQFNALFQRARALNLPMVCANPDTVLENGNKLRYCAGVWAERYQGLGGEVFYYGKPYSGIYEMAFQKMDEWGITDRKKILMIGDTLETDILGANNVGMDAALVLSGNTGREVKQLQISNHTEQLQRYFKEKNIEPHWILTQLSC